MAKINHICAMITVVFFALPLSVYAEPGKIVPFVSVKQEYNDNILFDNDIEEDDFITTGTAGLTYSYKTQRTDARLDGKLFRLLYKDNDQLDSTDGAASARWNYQFTERVGIGTHAEYRDDSRRDRDTGTTGLVLPGDREKFDVGVSSNYMFSEVTRGEIDFSFGSEEIEDVNEDEDNDTISLNVSFSKDLSKTYKNTVGLLHIAYMNYDSELETSFTGFRDQRDFDSDIFQVYAGFSRDITELYNVYLQAGASYTDTTEKRKRKFDSGNEIRLLDQDSSSYGGVLLAGLNYDGLYYDIDLSVSQDVRAASGTNGAVERSAVSLGIDRKVSDDFYITFDTSLYLNRNDRETREDFDELTFNIQPGFRYKFWDTFTLTGVYRFTSVDDREDDTTSERNMVYFLIKKEFEL